MRFKIKRFIMWICNSGEKVISGFLKNLLVGAGHLIIYDLLGFEKQIHEHGYELEINNSNTMQIIQTLKQDENKIVATLNPVFENLSSFEKIYAIHYVLNHLFDSQTKAPDPSLWMNSTIDVLFNIIKANVIEEIENKNDSQFNYFNRSYVVKACKEYFPNDETIENIDDELYWEDKIDSLLNCILLNNDFNNVQIIEKIKTIKGSVEIEGQYLPTMKVEKKTIVKMIKDILEMK
jgi:hypothetical protein